MANYRKELTKGNSKDAVTEYVIYRKAGLSQRAAAEAVRNHQKRQVKRVKRRPRLAFGDIPVYGWR